MTYIQNVEKFVQYGNQMCTTSGVVAISELGKITIDKITKDIAGYTTTNREINT